MNYSDKLLQVIKVPICWPRKNHSNPLIRNNKNVHHIKLGNNWWERQSTETLYTNHYQQLHISISHCWRCKGLIFSVALSSLPVTISLPIPSTVNLLHTQIWLKSWLSKCWLIPINIINEKITFKFAFHPKCPTEFGFPAVAPQILNASAECNIGMWNKEQRQPQHHLRYDKLIVMRAACELLKVCKFPNCKSAMILVRPRRRWWISWRQ